MDVSIVIINFNTFDLTCRCIEHVIQRTKDISYEIILVDNASTNCDPDDFKQRFPGVNLIKSKENLGFAKGNNLGIESAAGDYILLLNSDAFLINNAVKLTFAFLGEHKKVAVVGARLEYPDGKVQHSCQRFPAIGPKMFELLRLQKLSPKKGERVLLGSFFHHNSLAYPDWIWGTFFMFRKSLLALLPEGKLDDSLFMYGEDMQWCLDFRRVGFTIAFVPQARVQHVMGGSGAASRVMMDQNLAKFMARNYRPWRRLLVLLLDKLVRLGR